MKFCFVLDTELVDCRFKGYDKTLIDTSISHTERHCGSNENIAYTKEDIADFHFDFNIKHENEGYYEYVVRLYNALVDVRLVVYIKYLIKKNIYSEINDTITLLCSIFLTLPAWFTFLISNNSLRNISSLIGHDYLQIKHVSNIHSGIYTCRITTNDENEDYS
ncbi:unnamed protein product [Rotaria sordida]|uniref:Ig-like domain-containing protein n=1 Tax=Rotaria sordida TaxID=392033 RepID=A0A813T3G9_9BILA|nr:unnamed protein product [Rotaria sordida]CAF4070718.1 unnamed protein product [Rotaria sordida]